MAVLFASLATPAFAHGNGRGEGGDGNGRAFGQFMANFAKEKHGQGHGEGNGRGDGQGDENGDGNRLSWGIVLHKDTSKDKSVCFEAADDAHVLALLTATSARDDAFAAADSAYRQALLVAMNARMTARLAARTAYLASAKDDAARATYQAAKIKADADWQTARLAAQTAKETAMLNARTAFQTAKIKADADFRTAKQACNAAQQNADVTSPAATTTLSLSGATANSIVLTWTAPGDDGATGTATSYDIRYSTSAIATDADWNAATQVSGEPTPAVAGTTQTMTVSGLNASTTYFFAIKATDEAGNVSALSNVPTLATSAVVVADVTAPAATTTLALSGATANSIVLTWTAPGDDGATGTATSYDIRYSTSAITDANFASATQVSGEPTPAVAGTTQTMTVSGLTANTAYFFAIKATDEASNVSALSNVPTLSTTL